VQRRLDRVAVFCGSSTGTNVEHEAATRALARDLVSAAVGLVYGGGAVGLMGVLADEVMSGGGEVIGVIPRGLFAREVAHAGISELIEVGSMHERKVRMYDMADGFVALPGGLGTIEELAEVTTWAQLGLHAKPVAVLDVDGFYGGLFALLDRAVADGFVLPQNRELVSRCTSAADVLPMLRTMRVPAPERAIRPDER
jgi:uncharacterized protein (TIGR00730 family)